MCSSILDYSPGPDVTGDGAGADIAGDGTDGQRGGAGVGLMDQRYGLTATSNGDLVSLPNGNVMLLPGWRLHLADVAKGNQKCLDRLMEWRRVRDER